MKNEILTFLGSYHKGRKVFHLGTFFSVTTYNLFWTFFTFFSTFSLLVQQKMMNDDANGANDDIILAPR